MIFKKVLFSVPFYAFLITTFIDKFYAENPKIVFFTDSEKEKLKKFFENDNTERQADLNKADTIMQSVIKKENSTLKNQQMENMRIKITNLTNRIHTNVDLINKLLIDSYTYNDIAAQCNIIGKKPQDILQASGARGSFFSGEKVEPLFLKINAINSKNVPEDIELAFKRYTESKDNLTQIEKFTYICDLSNQLKEWRNGQHTPDRAHIIDPFSITLLKEALGIFEGWITFFTKNPTITKDATANQKLKDMYALVRQIRQEERV